MASPNLNAYLGKISESSNYLKSRPGERDAGIAKLKTDLGYDSANTRLQETDKQLLDTERQLQELPQNITNRTKGRLITSGQRDRMQSYEAAPITTNMGNLAKTQSGQQTNLNRVDQGIKDYTTTFNNDSANYLSGLGNEADSLFKKYTAESAANSANSDRSFQREIANINANAMLNAARLSQPREQPREQPQEKAVDPKDLTITVPDKTDNFGNAAVAASNYTRNIPGVGGLQQYIEGNIQRVAAPNQSIASRLYGGASLLIPPIGLTQAIKPAGLGQKIINANKNIPVANFITKKLFGR